MFVIAVIAVFLRRLSRNLSREFALVHKPSFCIQLGRNVIVNLLKYCTIDLGSIHVYGSTDRG